MKPRHRIVTAEAFTIREAARKGRYPRGPLTPWGGVYDERAEALHPPSVFTASR